ncbi:MAG: trimeric intracellular cation channel family protein [Brevinematia bacterium]
MNTIYIFDLIGTLVFSATGTIRGIEKKLDIFGIFVISFLTAVGGGTIRDIILNQIPFYFFDINYTVAIILGMLLVILFKDLIKKYNSILIFLDALGLGVFSIIGATKALNYSLPDIGIVISGLITGIGGGILRDVLIKEIPFVLEKEIYATASIIGIFLFLILEKSFNVESELNTWISIILITTIRVVSYKLKVNLPKL